MKLKVFLMILSGFLLWTCGPRDPQEPVQVTVKPNFFQLPAGGQGAEVQFSAEVSGTLDKAVEWSRNGAGSIAPSGRYRAPLTVTTQPAVITAKSLADPSAIGNGSVETTAVRKWTGEVLKPDMDKLFIGGYTVRSGQTIDLNRDNNLDLIALSKAENTATFFLGLGLGDGKFRVSTSIPVVAPVAVAVADFITEGPDEFAADAAIACAGPCATGQPSIVLIQGKTQENFSVSPNDHGLILPLGKSAVLLAAGRFHGGVEAANSDLVVGTADGSILLFLQNRGATVTFDPAPPIPVEKPPVQFEVADFNQDTFLDLIVVRESIDDILILLGNGSGVFPSKVTVPMPAQPVSIGVGDFNGDGIPDLAAAFSTLKTVSISIGNGDGTFQAPISIVLFSEPQSIVVEDVNLDRIVGNDRIKGNPRHDIAIALQNEILVLFGDGEGKMIGEWRFATGVAPLSLRAGFFAGLGSTQGFQIISLVYINNFTGKFDLINNANF